MRTTAQATKAALAAINDIPPGTPVEGPEINRHLSVISSILGEDPFEVLGLDVFLQAMYIKGQRGELPQED